MASINASSGAKEDKKTVVEGRPQDHEGRWKRSIRGEAKEGIKKGKMKDDNDNPLPASLSDGISPFLAKASMGETGVI